MAFIQCDFYSETLQLSTTMNVILPRQTRSQIEKGSTRRHPTLLLLHGLSDDHTMWVRQTSIERYAAQYGLAVIMPAVQRSFYQDMAYGLKYWTFISEELPQLARSFFPLSAKREDNFVAGLSMGGFGAFKLALNYPEKFAAAASLSGAIDVRDAFTRWPQDAALIYKSPAQITGSESDLFTMY
jgi:putative tributyrin esterase